MSITIKKAVISDAKKAMLAEAIACRDTLCDGNPNCTALPF
ncbi:hypothetical protein FIV00_03575 [Labrenzia sp. THAF82]|nr:hypothetical protein [Labrenzia sp. THAF82]QFT29549.1 hypothetical protein FIV00_03575 [Labrenzia sp. THAF82]